MTDIVSLAKAIWRAYWEELPRRLDIGLNRWLLRFHEPTENLDGDVFCSGCSNGWTGKLVPGPCQEWVEANERLRELQA